MQQNSIKHIKNVNNESMEGRQREREQLGKIKEIELLEETKTKFPSKDECIDKLVHVIEY